MNKTTARSTKPNPNQKQTTKQKQNPTKIITSTNNINEKTNKQTNKQQQQKKKPKVNNQLS